MFKVIAEELESRVKATMAMAIGYQLVFISLFAIPFCWFLTSVANALFWSYMWTRHWSKNKKNGDEPPEWAKMMAGFGLFGGAVTGISMIFYIVLSFELKPFSWN